MFSPEAVPRVHAAFKEISPIVNHCQGLSLIVAITDD
jgi:hypothetical protein